MKGDLAIEFGWFITGFVASYKSESKNEATESKNKYYTLLTARCRGLTGARTSESFRMSVPEVSIS